MVTSGALPTTTENGGRPDTSASLPGSLTFDSSTLPLRSLISTQALPLKRSVTVLVPAGRAATAAATSGGSTSGGLTTRGAVSAAAAPDGVVRTATSDSDFAGALAGSDL